MEEEKKNNDMSFEDSENYSGSSSKEVTKAQIILEQLRECIKMGSKEMCGGGTRTRIINGQEIEIMVPNQREIFVNSVEMLWSMVLPDFTKKVKRKGEKLPEEIINTNQITKQFKKNKLFFKLKRKQIKDFYSKQQKEENTKPIPPISNDFQIFDFTPRTNQKIKNLNNSEEIKKVSLSRKRLICISYLLVELNYYGEESITM